MQHAALSQALATGKGLESLHDDMQRTKVPWLEVHAPGGIQVASAITMPQGMFAAL